MKLFGWFLLTYFVMSSAKEMGRIEMEPILGWSNITKFIHGGKEVEPHSFPYQVGLQMISLSGVGICGGSLIGRRWIITAAHCLFGSFAASIHIGAHHLKRPSSGGQFKYMVFTLDFIIHEHYYHPFSMNDIGLIRTPLEIEFNERVQAIRLPSLREALDPMVGVEAEASGWGYTSDEGPRSETLQSVKLQVISLQECAEHFTVGVSNICTNGSDFKSPCKGDSGGPLVANLPSGPTLIGITAFGSKLGCRAGLPAVFMRVGFYLNWISQKTGIPVGL